MSKNYDFYIYIMASSSGTIYVGVTNNLAKRVYQHKNKVGSVFTKKYSCHKLIYSEHYTDIKEAIKREKEIKGWKREKKLELIKKQNPHWRDLYIEYFEK